MSKIGFVFDMDGVIVDSNPLHRIAWAEYNRRHGVETTEEMQQWMYGKRNDQIVRHFFGEGLTAEEIFAHGAAKEETYRQMLGPRIEEALVPGIRQFLELHPQIPAAVATNAEPANVNFVLDQAHLRRFFRVTVDGHQVANPKPHPEVYLRAAELLQIEPGNCVVFEDSYAGVQAGLAAGMRVVGVSTTHDDLAGVSLPDNSRTTDSLRAPVGEEFLNFLAPRSAACALIIADFNDPALELWLANLIQ